MNQISHVNTNKEKKRGIFDLHRSATASTSSSLLAPNPLKLFPSKSLELTSTFFETNVPKKRRELEATERWLNPDAIDPEFGIKVCLQKFTTLTIPSYFV